MASQSLKYDVEDVLNAIFAESKTNTRETYVHPNYDELRNTLLNSLGSNNASSKADFIQQLSTNEFLSDLSEDLFGEFFITLPSWLYNSLQNFILSFQKYYEGNDVINSISNLESAVTCVSALVNMICFMTDSSYDLPILNKLTVSETSLKAVRDCYFQCVFCKNLNDNTENVFKETCVILYRESKNLQKCVLSILEKVTISSNEVEIAVMVSCCEVLFNFLPSVCEINPKETVPILKTFAVMLTNYSDSMKDTLEVMGLVEYLCNSSQKLTQTLLSSNEDIAPSDRIQLYKLCNFKLKILVLICDKMQGVLESSMYCLVKFLIFLTSIMFLRRTTQIIGKECCTTVITKLDEKHKILEENILIGLDPLLEILILDRGFLNYILHDSQNNATAYCLLLTMIMDKIPMQTSEDIDSWLNYHSNEGDNFLKLLFKNMQQLCLENISPYYLPGPMMDGKSQYFNSLYHHFCTHICSFVATVPAEHFNVIEAALLYSLLTDCVWLRVLACDIWCFLSRYSTSALCLKHSIILTQLHNELPNDSYILYLIAKLFSFLNAAHQSQFLNEFPLEENTKVWIYLPTNAEIRIEVSKYHSQVRKYISQAMLDDDMTMCRKFDLCNLFLSHIFSVMAKDGLNFLATCLSLVDQLERHCVEWFLMKVTSTFQFYCKNLEFNDSEQSVLRFHESLKAIVSQEQTKIVVISIFLRFLSAKILPSEIVNDIPSYFCHILNCDNYILKLMGYEILSLFAHHTPHQAVLKNILKPGFREYFSSFLKQIPSNKELSVEEVMILATKILKKENFASNIVNSKNELCKVTYEHINKKPKLELGCQDISESIPNLENVNNKPKLELGCQDISESIQNLENETYEHVNNKPKLELGCQDISESIQNLENVTYEHINPKPKLECQDISKSIQNLENVLKIVENAWLVNELKPVDSKKIREIVEQILDFV